VGVAAECVEKATGSAEWWCVRGVAERGGARVRVNCDSWPLEQHTSWFQNDWSDWSDWSFPFWQQARFLQELFGLSLSLHASLFHNTTIRFPSQFSKVLCAVALKTEKKKLVFFSV
jgi:hypothetical protein